MGILEELEAQGHDEGREEDVQLASSGAGQCVCSFNYGVMPLKTWRSLMSQPCWETLFNGDQGVLVLGCGTGRIVFYAALDLRSLVHHGVEILSSQVAWAKSAADRHNIPNASFMALDALQTPTELLQGASLVVLTSLCWPHEARLRMAHRLLECMPDSARLCTAHKDDIEDAVAVVGTASRRFELETVLPHAVYEDRHRSEVLLPAYTWRPAPCPMAPDEATAAMEAALAEAREGDDAHVALCSLLS